MFKFTILVYVLFACGNVSNGGLTLEGILNEEWEIRNNIIDNIYRSVENQNAVIIPIGDHSQPLDIDIDLSLLALTNFDEITGEIDVVASLDIKWTDPNLPTWNSTELGGKDEFSILASQVWTPNLLLLNPATSVKDLTSSSDRVRVNSEQIARWNLIMTLEVCR